MNNEEHYAVTSWPGCNYYTDSITDAEKVYFEKIGQFPFAEILFGTPGHYESVRQSWDERGFDNVQM